MNSLQRLVIVVFIGGIIQGLFLAKIGYELWKGDYFFAAAYAGIVLIHVPFFVKAIRSLKAV